jgi:hypothetical protein
MVPRKVESDQGDVPDATISEARQPHNCGSRFNPLDIKSGDNAPRLCPFRAKTRRPEHDRKRAAFGAAAENISPTVDIRAGGASGTDDHQARHPPMVRFAL